MDLPSALFTWNAEFGVKSSKTLPIATISRSTDCEFVKGQRMEIHGTKDTGSQSGRGFNVVEWRLEENAAQKDGIPYKFICGMMVQHNRAKFKAQVDIQVRASSKWYQPLAASSAWLMQAW